MNAACHRCGGEKGGPFVPCKSCGFTPLHDDRSVAWLFSIHHLTEAELQDASERIRRGDVPDPSQELRDQAREAMGAAPLPDTARVPLKRGELVGLGLTNLLLTPLAGYAVWFGLRKSRPRAAQQALMLTVPMSLLLTLVWGMAAFGRNWL